MRPLPLFMVLALPALSRAAPEPADLVIRSARVITMDAARPAASALAVRGRDIVYVGDDRGAAAQIGPSTRVVEGKGRITVLPGLIDAHAHLAGLGLSLARLDLRGRRSEAEIAAMVREAFAKRKGAPGWILGRGWDQNLFSPPSLPEHKSLDAASPDVPVWLRRVDGHAGWANAEALRRAGVTRDTAEVAGGRIMRGADGAPTGVLIDNAMGLVERVIPAPSADDLERAILRAAEHVIERGLTGVHDMGVSREVAAIYLRLEREGRLPIRVFGYADDPIPGSLARDAGSEAYMRRLAGLITELGAPRVGRSFSLRGIKLYMDGALGSRGAALLEEYSDDPGNHGLLLTSARHIEEMARWGIANGYQIATHAIGDRANRLVLDAYEKAGVRPERGLRFRIEHAQVVHPDDQRRFAALGVIASLQPAHATSDMGWAGARLGEARLASSGYAWRGLLDRGARICLGSDFPVEEADPRLGLHAAVTRQDVEGRPAQGFLPAQRLSLGEAIRAFTADAAYAAFAEERAGQILAGRPADLTVLAGALDLTVPAVPKDLPRRQVLMTVIDGRVRLDRLGERGDAAR